MAFQSSSFSGSIPGNTPESIRGLWSDVHDKQPPVTRRSAQGFYNSSNHPGSNFDGAAPSASPPSSFISGDEWWKKKETVPPSAVLWPSLESSFLVGDKLFELQGSSDPNLTEKEYVYIDTPSSRGANGGVPVYVMLPLDSVNQNSTLNRPRAMNASMRALKTAGVEGLMVDVWWGIVEAGEPMAYNWGGYKELIAMAKEHGLKMQMVMSFHQCGGNVGDSCWIPLPQWVREEIDKNPDVVYTDKDGRRNYEYLSLGCDSLPLLQGRSPIEAYSDFMRAFRDEFKDYLGDVIVEIQVGLGPAGELRYPAYPEINNTWQFPGIGEFQCYDKYMLASLRAVAEQAGHPEWGKGGPHDAGQYKQFPEETGFFHENGSWNTPYGEFFLEWYSGILLQHGERILSAAEGIFRGTGCKLSGKVAGIHWHYSTPSHSAELTAGYYNTRTRDGYLPIAQMFGKHGVTLNFTCFEMRDEEQPFNANCSPEGLLRQVTFAARKAGVPLAGENALMRFDECAYNQVVKNSRLMSEHEDDLPDVYELMCSFTFLRMSEQLFQSDNWRRFVQFVREMAERQSRQPWEAKHHALESHMHATQPLVQEAEAAMMQK
ncbi:hypothetical protein KP509_06G009200 [Ceratopteris richardii]|uniref:Beta-amylase n=1 Tax=Ceratopteris richardii TaxID=49495 RepID=A0A8T2UDD9_CERRI|nr:hypothetical protein KP509_06G009200 [Ceratopteris richardii]